MTREALIRELATKPEFRILSELGREIVEKVRNATLKSVIDKKEVEPEITEEMEKFRKTLKDLDIISIEGFAIEALSDAELYEKAIFPVVNFFTP
jgi:hypothetical protein